MAKFENILYQSFGEFIRKVISTPELLARFKGPDGGEKLKAELAQFMTPVGKSWDDIEVVPHFDEDGVVHIAFPFTGDVTRTIDTIAPETGAGQDYLFPEHYRHPEQVNAGATPEEKKRNRLRTYHSRLGDYVMSRCF